MTNNNEIPAESKIIIGTEYFEKTGWFSLHLHDALYAVSFRPNQQRVVISEGRGPNRLRHFPLPFKNIVRFEAVRVPIGHNCLASPVDANQLGENDQIPDDMPFSPTMVRVLIKHSTRPDLISIHDLGATPTPIIVPLLRNIPEAQLANANISLSNANDCFRLAKEVIKWVNQVNTELDRVRNPTIDDLLPDVHEKSPAVASYKREFKRLCSDLRYQDPTVRQMLYRASAGIQFSSYIHARLNKERRLTRIASASPFCIPPVRTDAAKEERPVIVDLYEAGKSYHTKTGRPFEDVLEAIKEQLRFLKDLPDSSTESEQSDSLLEQEDLGSLNVIDPGRWSNKERFVSSRVWKGVELKHEKQLREVFKNERVEVHEFPGLPFLSLLMQYQTSDKKTNHAVVIKKGLHQALKEFLLAHEMGHWFLHVKESNGSAKYTHLDGIHHSSSKNREKEANNFGMMMLFPPAHLADQMIFKGELSVEGLLEDFLKGMSPVSERLKSEMLNYLDEHIWKYNVFKQAEEPRFLNLEMKEIAEEQLPSLLNLLQNRDDTYWVTLTRDSKIDLASRNSNELFGLPPTELKGLKPADLVVPEEVGLMRVRAEHRKTERQAIYYFTEVVNRKRNTSRQVIVYSFPILKKREYIGAVAVLRLLDEEKREVPPRPEPRTPMGAEVPA